MNDKVQKPNENPNTKIEIWKLVATVVIAIISCVSAVAVASMPPVAGWLVSLLPTKATPTPTKAMVPVPSDIATPSTNEPPTTIPLSLKPGEDWQNNCISTQWLVYPPDQFPVDSNDCYQQPVWDSISTKDGGFYIFAQPKSLTTSEEYGFFTELPQKATVSVSLDLDKLDNGQVWFGVFSAPNVHDTDGVLLVAPPGDVRSHAFALKQLLHNNIEKDIIVSKIYSNGSGIYSLGFDLQYGSITAIVEGTPLTPILYTSVTRWLFVGYRAKLYNPLNGTADIQALFTDLKIE